MNWFLRFCVLEKLQKVMFAKIKNYMKLRNKIPFCSIFSWTLQKLIHVCKIQLQKNCKFKYAWKLVQIRYMHCVLVKCLLVLCSLWKKICLMTEIYTINLPWGHSSKHVQQGFSPWEALKLQAELSWSLELKSNNEREKKYNGEKKNIAGWLDLVAWLNDW